MTATVAAPPRFERRDRGSGHTYALDGRRVPGVTTVLNALAKPGLVNWSAKLAAEYAVDNWAELGNRPPSERLAVISRAHRDYTSRAAVRGTRLHSFGWQVANGQSVDVPDELAAPVEAYARFLDTWQVSPVAVEIPVCHTRQRYGGTADLIADIPRLGRGIIDIKTGRGIYPETALQLAAYRFADLALIDGELIDTPATTGAYVAHVLPDSVELIPVDASADTWRTFAYLLAVYRWTVAEDDASHIGRAVHPEDFPA